MPARKTTRLHLPWTAAEERSMRRLAAKRWSAREFAERVGRSRGAVAYKAMVLGVHFRKIEQPRGIQQRIQRRRAQRQAA